MTVKASRVTVTTTATRLDVAVEADKTSSSDLASLRGDGQSIVVRNRGAASVFLGGSDVTAAAGFELQSTDPPITFDLLPGDQLYGVTASGTVLCHVAQAGV